MAADNENADRQVLPQWRTFKDALTKGELGSPSTRKVKGIDPSPFIQEKESDWKTNKELPFALDFISAAFVFEIRTPAVIEAAEFLLASEDRVHKIGVRLAKKVLGIHDAVAGDNPPQSRIQIVGALKQLKAKRINQPRNAFVWTDLARLYTILGQLSQAQAAIKIALALEPNERFVIRSAARFLHHVKAHDEALSLLRRNPKTIEDPWLLAAETAASAAAKTVPRFAKTGLLFLEKKDINPFHTSELASALATLEMRAGKHRHSNKLFAKSLHRPTQNALAQAVWATKLAGLSQLNPELLSRAKATEAITLDYYNRGAWKELIEAADKWAKDEGFSARPFGIASSIASSLLDQPQRGEDIANDGLKVNPKNAVLLNNKAFAQALQNKLDSATKTLLEIDLDSVEIHSKVCLLATTGLVYFRRGNAVEGRLLYEKAISSTNDPILKTLASLYLANEDVTLGNKAAFNEFKKAFQAAQKLKTTNIPAIAEHIAPRIQLLAAQQGINLELISEQKPFKFEGDFLNFNAAKQIGHK
jgi:tetratricopeptide (TPR) repeat protein